MSDFCYSRPMLQRVLRCAGLMDRMMQHASVNPCVVARADAGMAWYEARSRCIACRYGPQCDAWLQRSDAPAEAPEFCANAALFRRCQGRAGLPTPVAGAGLPAQ